MDQGKKEKLDFKGAALKFQAASGHQNSSAWGRLSCCWSDQLRALRGKSSQFGMYAGDLVETKAAAMQ